jgi:hypothetical protein
VEQAAVPGKSLGRRGVLRLRGYAPVKNAGKTKRIVKIKDKK